MGLFSKDGRDANHDGYVSPFDTDETQAYIDPAQVLERESHQADHQTDHRTKRQSFNAPDPRTRVKAQGRPTAHKSTRRNSTGHKSTGHKSTGHKSTGRKPAEHKANGWMALIVVIIAAAIAFGGVTSWRSYAGILTGRHHSFSSPSVQSGSDDTDDGYEYPQPDFVSDSIDLQSYDGKAGTFRIVSAERGPKDEFNNNRATIVVTYSWTNTGSKGASFQDICMDTLFQGGRKLATAYLYPEYGDKTPNGYDRDSVRTPVAKDGVKTVTIAYALLDDSTPVEVWLSDGSYDTVLPASFDVAPTTDSDGTVLQPRHVSDPMTTDGMLSDGDTNGMTRFDTYRGPVYARILDAHRGLPDIYGKPTVVVRIEWTQFTTRPIYMDYGFDVAASVNGGGLSQTKLNTNDAVDPGYDEYSEYRENKPGVLDTNTVAFVLPGDGNATEVTVTLTGSGSGRDQDVTATLPIAQSVAQ